MRDVLGTEDGTIGAQRCREMVLTPRHRHLAVMLLAVVVAPNARATVTDPADHSIRQFLARDDTQHPYRAVRRLEAETGSRKGWMEATTEYSPETGFRYEITAEGGSGYIRSRVLKAVLEAERDLIAQGEMARSSLAPSNYTFQANGIDADGLASVLLSPRRKERVLVSGMMSLTPSGGELVRLQGRLAKSPSVWVKTVDIVRTYERIDGTVVPVAFETKAQVRFLGEATLHMTYVYSEIDGRRLASSRQH
jgi:hypothetical protein